MCTILALHPLGGGGGADDELLIPSFLKASIVAPKVTLEFHHCIHGSEPREMIHQIKISYMGLTLDQVE